MHICTPVFARSSYYLGLTTCFVLGSLTGSLTLSVAYGANIESESDKFFSASEEAMAAVSVALIPGAFLVDTFPIRTGSNQKEYSQAFSRCSLTQSNMSRNGSQEPASKSSRGKRRRTLTALLTLHSNT